MARATAGPRGATHGIPGDGNGQCRRFVSRGGFATVDELRKLRPTRREDVAARRGDVPAETQPTAPMMCRYCPSSNALRVVVRMLPPLAIEMASLANSSSLGASMITTMS